jgi:hypothetical protein
VAGQGLAERQRAVADEASAYLAGPFRELPAWRALGPRLGGAAVLAVGARAMGAAAAPLEIEVLLQPQEWERAAAAARPTDLTARHPGAGPGGAAVRVRIRDAGWLRARLAEPPGLWLRQRAVAVADPGGLVPGWIAEALQAFRRGLPAEVAARYRDLREGLEGAEEAVDPLGRTLLLARAAGAALALPLLLRGRPYPPPRWLLAEVCAVCPQGEEIAACARGTASGRPAERAAAAGLLRLAEELLDQAGYGETLVRAYGRVG